MKLRALVIDPDKQRLSAVKAMLEKEGCDAVLAFSGAEAVDLLSQRSFDFILCDLQTSGPGAGELLRALSGVQAGKETKVKTKFLSKMTHELRTPLNAIIGFAELLMQETYGSLNPRQKTYIQNVITNGRDLLGRINAILDGCES